VHRAIVAADEVIVVSADCVPAIIDRQRKRPGRSRKIKRRKLALAQDKAVRDVAVRTVEVPPRDVTAVIDAMRQSYRNTNQVNIDKRVLAVAEQEAMEWKKVARFCVPQTVSPDDLPSFIQAGRYRYGCFGEIDKSELPLAENKTMRAIFADHPPNDIAVIIDPAGLSPQKIRRIDRRGPFRFRQGVRAGAIGRNRTSGFGFRA
jgi:hypothetical protein